MLPQSMSSWVPLCGTAVVSFVLLGASTALTIIDAITLSLNSDVWYATALAASLLDSCSLLSVVGLTTCRLGCSGVRWHCWLLPWSCSLISVTAAFLTLTAMVLKTIKIGDEITHHQGDRRDVAGQFTLWTLASIAQLTFYGLIMRNQVHAKVHHSAAQENASAEQPEPLPSAVHLPAPLPDTQPKSSTQPSQQRQFTVGKRLSILRGSKSHKDLLISQSSLSRASSVQSAETLHVDPFDTWETPQASASIMLNLAHSMPSKGTALETIPQSRPASPARALDGPFMEDKDARIPDPDVNNRQPSSHSQDALLPQRMGRTFIPASRALTPGDDESHIHPLFRTDSPTPPPSVSRDTVLTASPMGGQIMVPPVLSRPVSRKRSASQLSSRAASRVPSRANSFDELASNAHRMQNVEEPRWPSTAMILSTTSLPSSPSMTAEAIFCGPSAMLAWSDSAARTAGRSASPVGRGLTPPIPEFILSARQEQPKSKNSKETLGSSPPRDVLTF